jgi:hypothetical protein
MIAAIGSSRLGRAPTMRAPMTVCWRITSHSSAVSGLGFCRVASGMPILPMESTAPSASPRGDQDHRDRGGADIALEPLAGLVAGGAGQHAVEQDQLRVLLVGHLQRARAVLGEQQAAVVLRGVQVGRFVVAQQQVGGKF